MVWAKKSCFQLRFSWKCHQLIWIVQWWIWEWQSKFGFDICLFFPQTSFIPIHWLMNFPRLCALISYILISLPSDAFFRTGNRKNMSQRKFLGRALFFFIFNAFLDFLFFFRFCFIFEGVALQLSGCSSVLLLFTNFPIYFRNSQNFHQFISNPPVSMFHCHNATELNLIVNVSQKVWNLFRLNWHKFETSVVLHEINWKFRFCIKYVGSFEIVKAVAFWLSGCCCCWLQKQIMKVDHTAGVPSQWESKIKRAESYNKQKCSLSTIFRWHHKKTVMDEKFQLHERLTILSSWTEQK